MTKEYHVETTSDEWVTPEETLMDAGSNYSDLEKPMAGQYFSWLFGGFLILSAILVINIFNIGIIKHKYFSGLALQNKSVNYLIPPPRGMIYDRTGEALVKNVPSFDLMVVSREINLNGSGDQLNKAAAVLQLAPLDFISLLKEKSKLNAIFFAAANLTKGQVLALEFLNIKGLHIIPDIKRIYPNGPEYSSVLGYVGRVSKDDLETDSYYSPTDSIGKLGIEASHEIYLRGEHGRITFNSTADIVAGRPGKSVALNIDSGLQKNLYHQLANILAGAGLSKGAGIIQNPNTGQVLALVSFPSFNNNLFTEGLSDSEFKKLFDNPAKSLFNRAISGLYNPGSTIKPLIGLMALDEGVIRARDTIQDCVSISIGDFTFKNWRADFGSFNLRRAIANSCNVYFFTIGGGFGKITGLGIERISKYLSESLANISLGIDLPGEVKGFIPTADWKQRTKHESWYQGDTYNISIGQGDLIVTPIWLNSYVSAIANGGTIYQPQVANRIVDDQNNTVKVFQPVALKKLPFSATALAEIKSDMEETVNSGTAQIMKDLPISVGAKTGTTEVIKGRSINSLFIAFAPAEKPEIAITVLIEGSPSNQGLAIRTAYEVFKYYFSHPVQISPSGSDNQI